MIRRQANDVLVPFRVGAGQVPEHAAQSHPQGEDGLANVGAMLSSCSSGKQTALAKTTTNPALRACA